MNEKNFVIFKSPYLRYRKEDFGGVVKLNSKTFIVNRKQYILIDNMDKVLVYNSLNDEEKQIVDALVNENILLKTDIERAKEFGFKG
jgi:hypothetical protein